MVGVSCCISFLSMLLTFECTQSISNIKTTLCNYVFQTFLSLEYALRISDGTFSHLRDKKPVLKDINMRVKPGSLTALVGSVGCGKSSLLSALIGDLYKHSGTVTVKVRRSFLPLAIFICMEQ